MGRGTPVRRRLLPTVSRRLVTYLVVGVVSFGTDFGLLLLFREGFGTPVWVAGTVSYWTSVIVNYGLNRAVAFADRPSSGASLMRYGVLGLNWTVTLAVLDLADLVGVSYLLAKAAAVLGLTALNYVAYARWVFPAAVRA
jgi:putative flippase GtrA